MPNRSLHAQWPFTLLVAIGAGLSAQTAPPPIDNDQVRVLKVTDRPHTKSRPHEHQLNRVMVYFQGGRQEITGQDGKKTVLEWKAGDVKWSPASGTHVSELTSNAPVTLIEVEIKKDGGPGIAADAPLDPVKVDPNDYRVEFENSQVRVTRVRIAAGRSVPLHEHVLSRVVVYLSDQNTRMTTPDGKTDMARHKAGEVSWGAPAKHKEENLQDRLFEVVVVELKSRALPPLPLGAIPVSARAG